MTQQTSGTAKDGGLRYSKETFDDLYEACKGIIAHRMECHEIEAAYVPPEIEAVYKALAKVEGRNANQDKEQ